MRYEKVVGQQINGDWVLFKLPNGVAACVDDNGETGFFYSWAQALRFTMIDARGTDCVPAEKLRNAIEALKKVDDNDKNYQRATNERDGLPDKGALDELEEEHEEWCRNAKTHPDGSLVWGYDED